MAKLKVRLQSELGSWRIRVPRAWRSFFDGVQLDFESIAPDATLAPRERIWPQENNAGPAGAHLFKAFKDLRPEQVRVVVFGNDPYTRLSQATGRSFEQGDLSNWVRDFDAISPSLKTVLAAAAATSDVADDYPLVDRRGVHDYKKPPFGRRPLWLSHLALELALRHGALHLPSPKSIFRHWSSQGVLWINRTLTFTKWDDEHRASHERMWAPFTDRVLDVVMSHASTRHSIVFVMWGSKADDLEGPLEELRKEKRIPPKAVHYLKTGHPQWVEGYFGGPYPKFEPEKTINPLQEINRVLGRQKINWLKTS